MNNCGNYHLICVGVNPAFDVTLKLTSLQSGEVSRAYGESIQAAGKALNVCRTLCSLGADAEYLCLLGLDNSRQYISGLDRIDIPYEAVRCVGMTRENLTLLVNGYDKEFKINREGFTVSGSDTERLEQLIGQKISENADKKVIVVFSGSMPKGMTAERYAGLMKRAKQSGALLAVDTESLTARQLTELEPWLYKPNEAELRRLFDISVKDAVTEKELPGLAQRLCESGTENVLLTLGEKGLFLITRDGAHFIEASEKRLINTTGAGDRTLAGFVAAYCTGMDKRRCAEAAARCGENENL